MDKGSAFARLSMLLNAEIRRVAAAGPGEGYVVGAGQFPTGGVGHGQRRATIREAVVGSVHPHALGLGRHQLGSVVMQAVAIELHRSTQYLWFPCCGWIAKKCNLKGADCMVFS